jgi:AraC-like DNA-binding protein
VEKTLREHVWDVIRTRTNHDRLRAKRYRHEPLDVFDPEAPEELLSEVELALADRATCSSPELATLAAQWLGELRRHVAPSSDLGRMLDAFEAGATTMGDVAHLTGLSEKEYCAARLRLDRLVNRLTLDSRAEPNMRRKRA